MRTMLAFVVLAALAGGCVTESHRRLNQHNKVRGERIAANENAPEEVRRDGAEVAAAATALQKQAVPPPETAVQGTTEELKMDIAKAGVFDTVYLKVKQIGKTLLEKLASTNGVFGGLAGAGIAVAGWLAKRKKQVQEAGNRLASAYREYVPENMKAKIDERLTAVLEKWKLPAGQASQFIGWEHTPDPE